MTEQTMTCDLAWAAAHEAANQAMRAGGREHWSRGDYDVFCDVFGRLWPETWRVGDTFAL